MTLRWPSRLVALLVVAGCGAAMQHRSTSGQRKYGSSLLTPSGGTIIGVTAGSGLTGGGTTGNVTVNVGAGSGITVAADTVAADTTYVQKRIGGSCVGSNAIQTVNADGSVVCVAAGAGGGGTVTNVATSAPLTGGPITTTGTLGLSESSNLRNNGSTLDLSTAVVMPGSLTSTTGANTFGALIDQPSSQSISGTVADLTWPSLQSSQIEITCAVDTQIAGLVAASSGREINFRIVGTLPCVFKNEDSTDELTAANRITGPNEQDIKLYPGDGGRLTYDGTASRWGFTAIARGAHALTCSAGTHVASIDTNGDLLCSADAPTNGLTGTLTTGDLVKATGTNTAGNYAGSTATSCTAGNAVTGAALSAGGALTTTCTAIGTVTGTGTTGDLPAWSSSTALGNYAGSSCAGSTVATAISAAGGLTCGVTPITGTLTTNTVPLANGANSLTNSSIADNGTTVSTAEIISGSKQVYAKGGTSYLYWGYECANATNAAATCTIDDVGYNAGTGQPRTLTVGDGQGSTGSHLLATFEPAAVTAAGDNVVALGGHLLGASYTPGVPTGCGTSPSLVGSDQGGIVTVGTGGSSSCTVPFGHAWVNAPSCTANFDQTSAPSGSIGVSPTTTGVTFYASFGAGAKFTFTCVGY